MCIKVMLNEHISSWLAMRVCTCLKGTTEMLKWGNSLGTKNFLDAVAKVSLGQCFPNIPDAKNHQGYT